MRRPSAQSQGKTSYCIHYLSLDNQTWVPGILLEGLQPKEAKPSILQEVLLPKEGSFQHLGQSSNSIRRKSVATLTQLGHTDLRTKCVRLSLIGASLVTGTAMTP